MRLGARLNIKLNFLKDNLIQLKQLAPKAKILFMVKANGYGHGMVPITKFSFEENGITSFGVATLSEAVFLRQSYTASNVEIYVFSENHFTSQLSQLYKEHSLIPVISSLEELEKFLLNSDLKKVPLVLKFNTGMNRLGLLFSDIEIILKKIKNSGRTEIEHLMTHFSRSTESVDLVGASSSQYHEFSKIKEAFKANQLKIINTSVSNSGAIEQSFGLEESFIRPGLMTYGPSSLVKDLRPSSNWKGKNVSALEVQVLRKFRVKKGMPIGYGGTQVPTDGYICIMAIGYGDGFSTKLQNVRLDHLSGRPEIFGRINMDMTQLFFRNDVEEINIPNEGDFVNFWGHQTGEILSVSDQSGIIPYELFCNLNSRVPRNYIF